MDLVVFGIIAVFLLTVIVVLERTKIRDQDFSSYATGGRSFNSAFGTMAFINTWLPGTIFISFAGLSASAGVIGFYFVQYSILAALLMYVLAKPVYRWGKRYDLKTQADLLRLRYGSRAVQVIAALIGGAASIPWVVLGMQSLAIVFTYGSGGRISPLWAVVAGILLLSVRQIWTVRFGMRGIMISDMVQGIAAYFIGTVIIFGLIFWLIANGHGFAQIDPALLVLPGPGSELGPLYLFSLVLTGAVGGWCWPDIFVRLFTQKGVSTIRRSALQATPILFVFGTALSLMAVLASTVPEVAAAPDAVWFEMASIGGPALLGLAAVCVIGASMGNVGANLQAIGATFANDVVAPWRGRPVQTATAGRIAVATITLISAVGALATASTTTGLIILAQISYQGICQLAPTLFLGIFWRRATAAGACTGMIAGIATAAVLQWLHPLSIPWLGGVTSGVAGLAVNTAAIVLFAYLKPHTAEERRRVDALFAETHQKETAA